LNLHTSTHQLYLYKQHSKSFKTRSAILRLKTLQNPAPVNCLNSGEKRSMQTSRMYSTILHVKQTEQIM